MIRSACHNPNFERNSVMEPFLGSLLLVPYNFAPQGWAFCQGQLMPISQNTALFSLKGTTYGGDGVTTFALPQLDRSSGHDRRQRRRPQLDHCPRGRLPIAKLTAWQRYLRRDYKRSTNFGRSMAGTSVKVRLQRAGGLGRTGVSPGTTYSERAKRSR